ncbi:MULTISPECIES: hypothetical protein [unclassified Pseudoalteromonas]|uniref:hypothetical protein n=1 Tax=unclassified Pseudoalteromonas TaxID=194690 RepID=UPI000C068910|nr:MULTISPECIES: hypothetical protein [unclassified Pseudoalteromonas]MDP2633525.1 hypothetical protein [Pseudoalteromonas sp. 1_MG-2023]PHN90455.1 hypothetical protein CSC79_07080 [Pseudoalteromonas sp. 3D05]
MEDTPSRHKQPKNKFEAFTIIKEHCAYLDSMELMSVFPSAVDEMTRILSCYEDITIEESDLSWISEKNKQQLFWAWVYIHQNPIKEVHYKPENPLAKEAVYTFEEIYPLLVEKFDSFKTTKQCKRNYIKNMKHSYHQFLTSKPSLEWLTDKADDDCIWVWGYLTDKLTSLNFLKPLSNEDLFHSIIAIIANWDLLHHNANTLNKDFIGDLDPIVTKPQEKTPTKKELISKLTNAYKQREIRTKSQSLSILTKNNHKLLLKYMKEHSVSEKKALNEIVEAMLD